MSYRFIPPEERDSQTLRQVLARRAGSRGDAPWIAGEERSWTYRDLDRMSNRIANGLAARGVAKGETVLVMLPDCIEFIAAWCGLAKLGAVQVPVNTHLRGSVLSHVVGDSRARTMIVHARFLDRIAGAGIGSVESLIVLGEMPGEVSSEESGGWPDALARLAHSPFSVLLAAPDTSVTDGPAATDLVAVLYTSGTTGPSKGVMISHIQAYEYARSVVELLELVPDDVYYAPLPLFHIAGQWGVAYAACLAGAQAVLARPFSASAYWPDVRRHRATATFLLGAMANFLFQQPEAGDDAGNPLERALVVPLLPEIEAFKRRFGCLVSTTWGATEFNVPTRSTFNLANNRTCGRVAEDRYEVRIVDERGTELEERAEGSVEFRGPSTTSGYFRNPAATRALFDGEWLRSGDRGYVAGGELYITGRDKDLIVRAGRNLYPYDLEAAVGEVDGVRKGCVAVFASPDPAAGTERLVVVAETRESEAGRRRAIEEAIVRVASAEIGAAPDEIVLAPPHSVLKTSSGKIRRVAVRELFESGALRRGAASVRMQVARLALAAAGGTIRSWTRRAARAAYAAHAGVVAAATFVLAWLGVVVMPGSKRARWRRGRVLARAAFRVLGIRIRASGLSNMKSGERYVLVANHASYLDGLLLFAAIPARVGYVVKGELAANPFIAPLLRALGAEFVNRLDHERSVADAASLAARLARGDALGFFPEGTLHRMPGLLPFRLGAFSAAVEGGARVVPVTITGTRSAMRDGQWIPRPGTVSVRIAPPIAPPPAAPPVTPDRGSADEPGDEPATGSGREAGAEASHGPSDEPGAEPADGPDRRSVDGPVHELEDGSSPEPADGASQGPADGSSGEPAGASSWTRAVKLRDAARAVILAQCGEPDLGARLDVLDVLRRRKREEGME